MHTKIKSVSVTDNLKNKADDISEHERLVIIAAKWLRKHSNNIQIPNCSTVAKELSTANISGEIPDIIGWCYWTSILIEVKVSRADFLQDNKKTFRIDASKGMGEFRYYCCPEGLILESEIPDNWGLLYCNNNNNIEIIKLSKKNVAHLANERTMLLSLIRRKIQ